MKRKKKTKKTERKKKSEYAQKQKTKEREKKERGNVPLLRNPRAVTEAKCRQVERWCAITIERPNGVLKLASYFVDLELKRELNLIRTF